MPIIAHAHLNLMLYKISILIILPSAAPQGKENQATQFHFYCYANMDYWKTDFLLLGLVFFSNTRSYIERV